MARLSIDEKIAKQEEVVKKWELKYNKAIEELEALKEKKNDEKLQQLMDAIKSSSKSVEDVMSFLSDTE